MVKEKMRVGGAKVRKRVGQYMSRAKGAGLLDSVGGKVGEVRQNWGSGGLGSSLVESL